MPTAKPKLTQAEIGKLIAAAEKLIPAEKLVPALVEAIGPVRAAKLVLTRRAIPWTKADTEAVALELYPLIPGANAKAKRRNLTAALKPCFATAARYEEVMRYALEKVTEWLDGEPADGVSSAYPSGGTVCGYGPVNNHWKIPDQTIRKILDRMQAKNVRAYKVESVGHASEDVLGKPDLLAQMKAKTLFSKAECAKRGIVYHVTLFNDNAGKNTWKNQGPSLGDRLPQCKAFIDWFAANVDPAGTFVVIVGETRTSAGKELEKYGARVLKAAGFKAGNNNGSRPQATTSFGGFPTDFFEYHPTKTSDWPKSKAAHVTSDTGAILAQLNHGGNVYGLGNPAAVSAWRAAGVAKGFAFVIYYGFDVAEYDEASIDAMSPGPAAASPQPAADGDVDLSAAVWHGAPNGSKAKVLHGTLSNLTINSTEIRYSIDKVTDSWEPHRGSKQTNQCACFFVRRNGVLVGGRFDDSTWSRKSRELKNIRGKYTGGIVPVSGEDVWFCFTDVGGTVRTNCSKVTWP